MKKLILIIPLLCGMSLRSQNASEYNNTAGISVSCTDCSAFGAGALSAASLSGSDNTAQGFNALMSNNSGSRNTAMGKEALYNNTTGDDNTAAGYNALYMNISGSRNTGAGTNALRSCGGNDNTGVGFNSMPINNSDRNTGFGIFPSVLPHGNNQVALGQSAITNQDNHLRVGDANLLFFQGALPTSPGITITSDRRFKDNISESDVKGIEFIKKLRAVSYYLDTKKYTEHITAYIPEQQREHYLKSDFRKSSSIRRTGFLAQEVEKAALECGYNFDAIHKPENEFGTYGLTYEMFVVPLVKAMQEQQQVLSEYKEHINRQKALLAELNAGAGQVASLSIEKASSQSIQVSFSLPAGTASAIIGVYDLKGKELLSYNVSTVDNKTLAIPSSELAEGLYICSLIADGEIQASGMLAVQKK